MHTVVRSKSVHVSDETKTQASRRELNLFPVAEKCLRSIQAVQEGDREFYGSEYRNDDGYVFCWEDGHMYDPNYVTRAFVHATKEFGRPEITLHNLRHSYAHFNKERLNANDNDLSQISEAAADLF